MSKEYKQYKDIDQLTGKALKYALKTGDGSNYYQATLCDASQESITVPLRVYIREADFNNFLSTYLINNSRIDITKPLSFSFRPTFLNGTKSNYCYFVSSSNKVNLNSNISGLLVTIRKIYMSVCDLIDSNNVTSHFIANPDGCYECLNKKSYYLFPCRSTAPLPYKSVVLSLNWCQDDQDYIHLQGDKIWISHYTGILPGNDSYDAFCPASAHPDYPERCNCTSRDILVDGDVWNPTWTPGGSSGECDSVIYYETEKHTLPNEKTFPSNIFSLNTSIEPAPSPWTPITLVVCQQPSSSNNYEAILSLNDGSFYGAQQAIMAITWNYLDTP